MDILFFTEVSPYLRQQVGGAETSTRLIAENLAARGHRVTFASLRPDPVPFPKRLARNGIDVLLLPSPRKAILWRLLDRLGGGESPAGRALAKRLWDRVGRGLFRNRRIDVLYVFYEIDFLKQALRARARLPGMAIMMRMAGLNWYEAIRRSGDPAVRDEIAAVFAGVDAINYLSPASRDLVMAKAAEVGLPLGPKPGLVADIGVDASRVPLSWQGPGRGRGLRIVVAARFSVAQKRQDILVEAVARLKGRLAVTVTMIGSGARRKAIARRRDELGLAGAIEILPFLPQEELWARMRTADLLCHPCDYEGLGKIILESMMLGLPVLVSDVEPLSAYVIDGETGFRAANDPDAWAEKLIEIAARKEDLPVVSARARAFVEANYDVSRNIDLYEAQFSKLLETIRGAAARPRPEPEIAAGTQ